MKSLSSCNLKRISKQESFDYLIELITEMPLEEDDESRKYLYPLNAASILKSNSIMILNHLFKGDQNQIKQVKEENFLKLLDFFKHEEINQLLAGYVCGVLNKLMEIHYHSILEYFQKNQGVLNQILEHCYNKSVMDEFLFKFIFNF